MILKSVTLNVTLYETKKTNLSLLCTIQVMYVYFAFMFVETLFIPPLIFISK